MSALQRETVGVVLVAYRSGPGVPARARELAAAGFLVRVVDNSGEYPDEAVIDPGRNLGFGAACNAGVSDLPPSVTTVVFHNPDVSCGLADLDRLVAELRACPHPGVVAAAERHPDGSVRRGYRYPSAHRELLLSAAAIGRRWGLDPQLLRRRTVGSRVPAPQGTSAKVFGSGALMAVDRERFERIGGFDPRYFLYVEDLDLWERIRLDGGDVVVSALTIDHRVGTGSEASRDRRELLRWLGVELFLEDTSGGGAWRRARWVHRATLGLRGGPSERTEQVVVAHWRAGERPSEVQALLRNELERRSTPPSSPTQDVGVVVTCHDYGRFLAEAVESILAQDHPPSDVVIVDDASTDDTHEVMEALRAIHPGLRTITSPRRLGVAGARNLGLASLRTTYACCVDADDTLPPDYVSALLVPLLEGRADIAFAPLRPFGPDAASVHVVEGYDWDRQLTNNLINASALFRRDLLTVSGGFTSVLDRLGYEDWEFWTRLIADGARVAFVPSTGLGYRRHGEAARNPTVGPRRLVARLVVWWRLRAVVRPRHLRAWVEPQLSRRTRRRGWTR